MAYKIKQAKLKEKKGKYRIVGVIKLPSGKTKMKTAWISNEIDEEIYTQLWTQDSKEMGGYLDDVLVYRRKK